MTANHGEDFGEVLCTLTASRLGADESTSLGLNRRPAVPREQRCNESEQPVSAERSSNSVRAARLQRWTIGLCGLLVILVGCGDDLPPPLSAEALLDPASCQPCHPQHYAEWAGSMHAYAAEDPVFLAMNARAQRDTDGALGTFCVQCHAPLAVELGLTTDGTNLDEVPRHLKGVTCAFCHQVSAIEGAHNNQLRRATDGVMRGGIKSPQPTSAHASAYSALMDRDDLRSSAMCGSCHDVVLPNGFHLERTYAEWQATVFNSDDPLQRNTCNDCHLPGRPAAIAEGGPVRRHHDHSMPGVDVALTPFFDVDGQRQQVLRELSTLLVAELCVIPRAGGAEVEVYLENIAAGHLAPSGAAHDRRMWVELVAYAGDEVVYSSGVVDDETPVLEVEDDDLWRLGDRGFDADGQETHIFWEVAQVESTALPASTPLLPGSPGFVNPHVGKRYVVVGETPDRITMRVRIRPIGLDILEDLVASGDLAASIMAAMPTFDLAATVLTWTADTARPTRTPLAGREALCVPFNL